MKISYMERYKLKELYKYHSYFYCKLPIIKLMKCVLSKIQSEA